MEATKDDPQGTETPAKMDDALRQTRTYIFDYLSQYFDDQIGLKPSAFQASGGSLPTGYIRGAHPTTGEPQEIAPATIRTQDIADLAVTTVKLADASVTSDKIGSGEVKTVNIQDLGVTQAKLAVGAINGDKIADFSIGPENIVDGAITTVHIGERQVRGRNIGLRGVTGDKLMQGLAGEILVGGNTVNGVVNCFVPKKLSGAMSIDSTGKVSLNAGFGAAYARVVEKVQSGGASDTPTAVGDQTRGTKTMPWVIEENDARLVGINGAKLFIKVPGLYLIQASAPAYKVDGHRLKLVFFPDPPSTLQTLVYYGTSEYSAVGATNATRSEVFTVIDASATRSPLFQYFELKHYINTIDAASRLGLALVGDALPEIYAVVNILKLG